MDSTRYELLGVVGTGGMATVWRADDHRLGRRVAVKRPNDVGDVAEFAITNAPANRVALVLIGLQQSNIPLASIGAPGCTLLTPPIVILGGVTDNGGSARIDWQTPPSAAAIGLTVHSQAAIADQPANPFGAITTRAVSITMGGWQ